MWNFVWLNPSLGRYSEFDDTDWVLGTEGAGRWTCFSFALEYAISLFEALKLLMADLPCY